MKLVKRVFFDKEGEKKKLTELADACKDENALALAISGTSEFGWDKLDFAETMQIATYWLKLQNKK